MSAAELSAFAFAYAAYDTFGLHLLAIMPGTKVPGVYFNNRWTPNPGWTLYCTTPPSKTVLSNWARAPLAGIGAALGSPIDDEWILIALDFDALDPVVLAVLLAAAAWSPMVRVGSKGEARFFRAPRWVKSMAFNVAGVRVLDILAHGRQIVLPPSIHPEGMAYRWIEGPVDLKMLPLFGEGELATLLAAVRGLGGSVAGAVRQGAPDSASIAAQVVNRAAGGGDFFRELNDMALANLGAWVPQLPIANLRRKAGGWEGTASWRQSNTDPGKPLARRKRNLSFVSRGISDFGDGPKGYSPINVVMAAEGLGFGDAVDWLSTRLGMDTASDPFFAIPLPTNSNLAVVL
jgi:hypothetical protein